MSKSKDSNSRWMVAVIVVAGLAACVLLALAWHAWQYDDYSVQEPVPTPTFTNQRGMKARTDTSRQNILLIGDSMAYTLMFRAQNYCNRNGHSLNVVSWVSATSRTFAICDTLEYYVNLCKPTYIIFVIGANEMFKSDARQRGWCFDHIVQQSHGIPMVMVGPPNWREDSGINDVMMERFGPRQFFLSKRLRYSRIKGDVVHPDRASGSMWMDSIAAWIMRDSYFPIRLETPVEENPIHVDFDKLVLRDPNLT